MNFDSLSILMIWTAVAIYAAAFIAYAFDLAKRSQAASDAKFGGAESAERELVGAVAGAGAAERSDGSVHRDASPATETDPTTDAEPERENGAEA